MNIGGYFAIQARNHTYAGCITFFYIFAYRVISLLLVMVFGQKKSLTMKHNTADTGFIKCI